MAATATYPPPPPYYSLYKDYIQNPKSAPEPPPPIEGTYVLFGGSYTTDDVLPSLEEQGGVENVYTQHQPLLFQTMENIIRGRLRDVDYPFIGNHFQQGRPQEVVIFIVGGTTYEESRSVALQNATNSGIRFILGGSVVLNSKRHLECHLSSHGRK